MKTWANGSGDTWQYWYVEQGVLSKKAAPDGLYSPTSAESEALSKPVRLRAYLSPVRERLFIAVESLSETNRWIGKGCMELCGQPSRTPPASKPLSARALWNDDYGAHFAQFTIQGVRHRKREHTTCFLC
ncbi:MAG: hypothetical protein NZM43_03290 [Saprospiraceae bacterium]|nr:hypothetical protein [Saprospiraceae bacterium]MDW8483328.1 hypothetical protein [Saprospiraceae bacterium]